MKTLFIIILFSLTAKADDVYNFYFQKAPSAAQTVQQSGEIKDNQGQITTKVVSKMFSETSREYKSSLMLGWANNSGFSGFGVSYDYAFRQFLSFYTSIMYTYQPYSGYSGDDMKSFAGVLGACITPFKIDIFGHNLLELGLVGGLIKYSGEDPRTYMGMRATINFTDHLGIQSEYRGNLIAPFQATVGILLRVLNHS